MYKIERTAKLFILHKSNETYISHEVRAGIHDEGLLSEVIGAVYKSYELNDSLYLIEVTIYTQRIFILN
jgi:hypothetical protein